MQVKITVEGDKAFERKLNSLATKQLPFAIAQSLTKTAKQAQVGATRQIQKDIDRPTPFTKKAVGIEIAKRNKPYALVFIKRKQAEYLKYQVYGGQRKARKGKAVLIPSRQTKKNQYGNLPKGKVNRLLRKNKAFKQGRLFVEVQRGDITRGLAYSAAEANYKPILRFHDRVEQVAKTVFPLIMVRSLLYAIKTAR